VAVAENNVTFHYDIYPEGLSKNAKYQL